ncbi:MAG: hypothetical protein JXR83_17185 [Deltaproteobacteria bacterium]|nr:hypothetical protein [Deltaproteobacteria bacterium]
MPISIHPNDARRRPIDSPGAADGGGAARVDRAGAVRDAGGANDAPDRLGDIPLADIRPIYGTRTAPIPDLMGDWRQATVQAAIEESARESLAPELKAAVDQAFEQLMASAAPGQTFSKRELHEVASRARRPILEAKLPGLRAKFAAMYDRNAATRKKAVEASVDLHRPRIDGCKDPFMPLARGDRAARANERILWENNRFMIIADRFAPLPKALIIPKQEAMLPCDLPASTIKELAQLASIVGSALLQLPQKPSSTESWINPPQHVSVRQLHVHVAPKMPHWDEMVADPADLPARQALEDSLYGEIAKGIAAALGPGT